MSIRTAIRPSLPLLAAALLIAVTAVGCKRAEREAPKPAPAPVVKEAPARTREQAMEALLAVPELKAWSEQIEKRSKGKAHGAVIEDDPVPRFFAFLLAFMGAMTGVVVSGNLVQLAFFWELTSLFSFLLIGYWHHTTAAREGARMALTVTATGGLALFAGMLVLGHIVGSYDLDAVLEAGDRIREHPLYLAALVLMLLGALTKSAQFPFHFWLPNAMAAPTPVSAYLHSATLVKAGVFLMARFWPVMAGTESWFLIVGTAGLVTMLLGAYVAIFQNDLKGLLAYSTISHLGLITLLLGLNSELALVAAVFHILNHAAFKASLFMAAGIIDHETGTRDIRRLSGLNRSMPFTARLALVAAAAMAGVPLLNGFISKEMFFAEALSADAPLGLTNILPFAAMLGSAFSVAYSLRFIHGAFFGPDPVDLPRTPHEPATWMRFPSRRRSSGSPSIPLRSQRCDER